MTNNNEQDVEPDAWLVKHKWIVNKNRSDRKITMSHPLSSHNEYSDPQPLFSSETIQEARRSERQRILDKMEKMNQEVSGTRLHSADIREALNKLRDELTSESGHTDSAEWGDAS